MVNFCLVDLDSILFLLEFLKQQPLDNRAVTEHFLSTVKSAVKNSHALKLKIKDYFDKLTIKFENMEKISIVLCSIDKYEMLCYLRKEEVFRKPFLTDDSTHYYIKWFQCFLAKDQLWNDNEQVLRSNLLQTWTDYCLKSHEHSTDILATTDKLLDAVDNSVNNNSFRTFFINHIIDFCFEQGNFEFYI